MVAGTMSLEEASNHVTQTNPIFALDRANIRGIDYPIFKNAPTSIPALLKASAAVHGEGKDDYLVYQNERWTYDEFMADACRIAHALTDELNLKPGDRVAVAMRNYPEFLTTMMGVSIMGGVVVLLNAWWTTDELDYAFEDSGAKTVFADGPRGERIAPLVEKHGLKLIGTRDAEATSSLTYSALLDSAPDSRWPETQIDPDDDFAVMYSSGTTGHPKGVVQTHRGAVSAVFSWLMTAVVLPLMAEEEPPAPPPQAILIVTPLFHVTASHPMFLLSLPFGAKVVLQHKWNAEEAVQIIESEKITRFLGVPTQSAELMVAAKALNTELPSLSFVGSGGAKRPPAQVEQLSAAFPHAAVASGWGMTETNAVGLGIVGPEYNERPGAAGRPYPPLQAIEIRDDNGIPLPTGEIGELTVKSVANMRCYLNKPQATAEVLKNGWLSTGDLGFIDEDGYVTIVDRKKDIIIRGGENIACLDVEAALHRHPDVIEACAFSVPDERLGETVGAGIQLKPDVQITKEELRSFLSEHIAPFKIPEHVWFREENLPRGATDKTDRRALRKECLKLE